MNAEDAEDAEDGSTERTPLYFLGTWYSTPNDVMPPRSMFHKATGGLFEKKKPRAQAGQATIHDLPSHVLAHRVAAHLSAADAARLMQAAGHVHRGELGHVMGQKKEETEKEVRRKAAPIVAAVRKLIAEHGRDIDLHLPDGTRVSVYIYYYGSRHHWDILIRRSDTETYLTVGSAIYGTLGSPDVAEIRTYGDGRIVETTPEDRRLLLEVVRQLTGKRVVTTWVKDARYKYGIGSKYGDGRDPAREKRLVQNETKANPGAVVVLLTGHLKR